MTHIANAQTETCGPFAPLPTTREQRGRAIAQQGGIRKLGAKFIVPSQTPGGAAPTYVVDIIDDTCTCPDHQTRRLRCKHIEASLFWVAWGESTGDAEPAAVPAKRKTYGRNWANYNRSQVEEKERFQVLLKSLVEGIEEPPRKKGPGRPPLPLRDLIFSVITKVYTGLSGRRASTDIRDCAKRGLIERAPCYNAVFACIENVKTTDILLRLVEESAAPLAEVENAAGGQFAQDSTGFSSASYERWFSVKHKGVKTRHSWTKLHLMAGCATGVVAAAKVSSQGDCPLLPELLEKTAEQFDVREVSADKAYLSKRNLDAIEKVGAEPFIPFKSNSVGAASNSPSWRRMWMRFSLRTEDFLRGYHKRSNVEAVVWSIKSKFGSAVRSKSQVAQINEVLAKVVVHNIVCIVHAINEHGIECDLPTPASAEIN